MTVRDAMFDKVLMSLRARDVVSEAEEATLRQLTGRIRDYPARGVLAADGEILTDSTLLLSGLVCRCKDLKDGSRQITGLHVPGDFLDLHGFTLKRLDHTIMALAQSRVLLVPHEQVKRLTEEQPHLTRLLWLLTTLDAAIHREWQVSLGRRSAFQRLAHMFCELRVRFAIVGLADDSSYELNLTQETLAECMGLTSVHVSRTLKELREAGLVDFRNRTVTIHDLPGLERAAGFDPGYLNLERRPR